MVVFWDRMRVTRLSVSFLEQEYSMVASTYGRLADPKTPKRTGSEGDLFLHHLYLNDQ